MAADTVETSNLSHSRSSLRVLMVIPGDESDSASMPFVRRQADALEQAGVAVYRFFLASRTSPVVLLREQRRFRQEITRCRPDVVHAQFGTMTAFFAMISTRIPLVITFRGSDLNPVPSSKVRSRLGHMLSHLATLRATGIICVTEELRSRLWVPGVRTRAVVIPNSVNLETFKLMPRDEARQQLGWVRDEYVVLFNAWLAAPRFKTGLT
ncbi:MAG: glycosyltransferase [Chloroflexaceae bacterium]|nr:glycosyltransferase [Chloroflexaceae bacterium]